MSQALQIPRPAGVVSQVNGQSGVVSLSTSNIPEVTNLYYTNTRARAAISVVSTSSYALAYDSSTGTLTLSTTLSANTPFTIPVRAADGRIWASGLYAPAGNTVLDSVTASSLTLTNTLSVQNSIVVYDLTVNDAITVFAGATFYGASIYQGSVQVNGISGLPWCTDGFASRQTLPSDIPALVAGTTVYAIQSGLSAQYQPLTTTDPLSTAWSKIESRLTALSGLLLALGKSI